MNLWSLTEADVYLLNQLNQNYGKNIGFSVDYGYQRHCNPVHH